MYLRFIWLQNFLKFLSSSDYQEDIIFYLDRNKKIKYNINILLRGGLL